MARKAAYCDVDGTLTATTIVTPLRWYKQRMTSALSFRFWMATLPLRGPWWLFLDRIDRRASNRAIYSNYAGLPIEKLKSLAPNCYSECIRPRLFAQAAERLAQFKRDGFAIILVTGSLDFIMQPLADEFGAECIAPRLLDRNGVATGELDRPPLTGKHKAEAIRAHAQKNDIDLSQCVALADAYGDLEALECAGHPTAVNPDKRLARIAADRKWPIERWGRRGVEACT